MEKLITREPAKRKPVCVAKSIFLLAVCIIAFTCACFAQDVIVTKDSKRINAKVTEVNVDNIKYKQFDNQDGPVYTLLKSSIVTILYQNGQVETFSTENQPSSAAVPANPATAKPVASSATTNTQKAPQVKYTGTMPSKDELMKGMASNAPNLYNKYKSASTLAGVGAGMTIGGVALTIIGAVAADKEEVTTNGYTEYRLTGPGAAVCVVGVISALAGTPMWIVGGIKKKKTRNAYLQEFGYSAHIPVQPSPYLQLKVVPNRLGLALVF